jgi:thymidylate synthase ThyX
MAYEAKVVADSICNGHRLTTMQLTHPRIVHAEFNTHCMFSRNASSSRAIPFSVTMKRVFDDPFIPVWWGKNQKGMQAAETLTAEEQERAVALWSKARDYMVEVAREMADPEGLNIHKQIVNRLLEPFSWITVAVTGDWGAWSNYFALRCHPDAQPEIQKQAYMAQLAYFRSKPYEMRAGDWHMPYLHHDEYQHIKSTYGPDRSRYDKIAVQVSVGRCARTSYLTQEGVRDLDKDIELHDRLAYHKPMHASPFEHVCQAMGDDKRYAKYVGWKAYRHKLVGEYVTDFQPNHPELIEGFSNVKAESKSS